VRRRQPTRQPLTLPGLHPPPDGTSSQHTQLVPSTALILGQVVKIDLEKRVIGPHSKLTLENLVGYPGVDALFPQDQLFLAAVIAPYLGPRYSRSTPRGGQTWGGADPGVGRDPRGGAAGVDGGEARLSAGSDDRGGPRLVPARTRRGSADRAAAAYAGALASLTALAAGDVRM
jgi:hypothetical protein